MLPNPPDRPDAPPQTLAKAGLLSSLYFTQGLPFGFFVQALPVLARQAGATLTETGLASLLVIPWGLKFLWAPLVDRYGGRRGGLGRRRSWILPLQLLSVLTLLALAAFPPAIPEGAGRVQIWLALAPAMAAVVLTNLMAATQDIATDGLAVSLLSERERGLGNGIQVAGYRLGMIVGGGLILRFYPVLGWSGSLLAMAGLLTLTSVPVALHRERPDPGPGPDPGAVGPDTGAAGPGTGAGPAASPSYLSAALDLWRRPGAPRWLLVLFLYKAGESLATGMLRPFLLHLGLGLPEIGALVGVVGSTAGLVGSLLGGVLVNRLGRRRAIAAFGALQALAVCGYGAAALGLRSQTALYAFCAFEHLASGLATAALFTAMMDVSRPRTGATDYTLQACVVVNATIGAAAVSGISADALGYAGHFALCAGVCLLGLCCAVAWAPAWESLRRAAQEG